MRKLSRFIGSNTAARKAIMAARLFKPPQVWQRFAKDLAPSKRQHVASLQHLTSQFGRSRLRFFRWLPHWANDSFLARHGIELPLACLVEPRSTGYLDTVLDQLR